MNVTTLPRFLLGSRTAILEVAHSRRALLCGALFVISAGFAREYDGEDLIHEPWHLFRPLVASLVSGTVLFLLIHAVASVRAQQSNRPIPDVPGAWCVFMGLFWMTAPLAWLYAVPYERFLSPVEAIQVNLWTLAIVAAWRVGLMTRVVAVLYGVHPAKAFFLVMLFSDVVAFIAVLVMPRPVIDVMGGLRQSERELLLNNVTMMVLFLTIITAPIWLVGAIASAAVFRPNWNGPIESVGPRDDTLPAASESHGLLAFAAVSILIWIPVLFFSQPEQMRRYEVERLLRSGRVEEAFRAMSAHSPTSFPPGWEPPPRLSYMDTEPDLSAVREVMRTHRPAEWVANIYLEKIRRDLQRILEPIGSREIDFAIGIDYRERNDDLPGPGSVAFEHAKFLLEHDSGLSEQNRRALREWVEGADGE